MKLRIPLAIRLLAVASIIAVGAGIYWYNIDDENSVTDNGISYSAPTEEELIETEQHKDSLSNEDEPQESSNQSGDDKKSVTPIISYWGQASDSLDLEINGYIPVITEKNGSCKATLTKDSETVSQSKSALDDAQSTSCGLIVVNRNKLSPGEWRLTLSYSSDNSEGSSEVLTVVIR